MFNEHVKTFEELYKYSNISLVGDWEPSYSPKAKNVVDFIRQNSKIITHLPYRPDILKFNDIKFEMVNTLLVPLDLSVNMEFLKAWKKKKWGIKTICFLDDVSDLSAFKSFKGVISDKVNRVHFAIEGDNGTLLSNPVGLDPMYKEFDSLKRVFPALSEVVGTFICHVPVKKFNADIVCNLKNRIRLFLKKFKASPKPDWCSLKIAIDFVAIMKEAGDMLFVNWLYLERLVYECRREFKDLHYIRLQRPSSRKFSLITLCYYAMIEFKTDQAEFQIALVMHRKD